MKLIATSKNKNRTPNQSEVIGITGDGWVVTKDGAFGDVHQDCEVNIEIGDYIAKFRKENGLSQQHVGWMLGKSRTSIIYYEKSSKELTLREFMILASYIPENIFSKLKKFIENSNPLT